MALHTTPEDHTANPPQSWQVVKVAPRAFKLRQADGSVLQQFTTRREAEEHKVSGFYVELYRKEGRWFAGEQVPGRKPYRPPLHRLTQTHTTPEGEARTVTSDSADLTAAEAQRRKVQRLRDAGRTFTEGPGWVEYPHPDLRGWSVRLEWADTTKADRAGEATPGGAVAGDPETTAHAAGRVAYCEGRPRAAGADAPVSALVAGMAVGTGAAAIFEAFTGGYDAAADEAAAAVLAQPDPAPAAQLPHQWPGQLDLFAPAG